MNISLPSYLWSWNLGDAIQTIAMRELVESMVDFEHDVTYRNRITGDGHEPDDIHILNGYLDERWKYYPAKTTIVAGVHVAHENAAFRLQELFENGKITGRIGCRDPHTYMILENMTLPCEFIGCATLTLKKSTAERIEKSVLVDTTDYDYTQRNMQLSHYLPPTISWEDQLRRASFFLDIYRKHRFVHTTRIHAALPCLAMGTHVQLERVNDQRLSLLDEIGMDYRKLTTLDVSGIAKTFKQFVKDNLALALDLEDGETEEQ